MKKRLLPFVLLLISSAAVLAQVWSPKAIGVLPANYGVDDISIVNDQVIWATTNDYSVSTPVPLAHVSKLIKSTDGGETWAIVDIEEAKGRFCWDIHAFDENTACITTTNRGSGNKRGIFRTTDGGTTWVEVFNHPSGDLWLHFFDSQEGVCGSGEDIARTTDGGATWTAVPAVNVPNLLPGEFIGGSSLSNQIGTSGHSIWFGTSKGRVFKTENHGQNWAAYTTGLGANSFLYSFGFIDEKNGLGVFEVAGVTELARTTDGGKSWTKTGNFNFTMVDAIPCANTFMGASYNAGSERTAFSTDFGNNWISRDTTLAANSHVFYNPEIGWTANVTAVGAGPALYKWTGGSLDDRIYVNQTATGANTGASWADAYTDLKTALTTAQAGDEIWVAEGTYKPAASGSNPSIATFFINKDLKLYGGFAGTECYLSERDIALHPTVLSGDLNGDDIPDDFTANRTDNSRNIIRIESNITNETCIDGFTISNGQAQSTTGFGAGIRSLGSPVIRHCVFTQNYAASSGAGLFLLNANAAGAKVEHCQFLKNQAVDWTGGGGMYVRNVPGESVSVSQSVFQGNTGGRGSGLSSYNSNVRVSGSTFKDNVNQQQGGGLWFCCDNYSGLSLKVDQCTFEGNKSSFGGGLYFLALSGTQSPSVHLTRSTFKNNAVLVNLSGWDQAGGGLGITVDISVNNTSVKIDSCLIEGNTSTQGDAGLFVYSDGNFSNVLIENCLIDGNASTTYGAGMGWYPRGTDFQATVRNTRIVNNQSVGNGGAVNFRQLEPVGVFPNNAFTLFENCLLAGNSSAGAAVSADSMPNLQFRNCTVANNAGGGIQLSDHSGLTLQNTILHNPGFPEYQALTGDVTVKSNGGNLIGDGSLAGYALSYDLQNTDPLFAAPGDYHLAGNSPAIDKGVDPGTLPALDLDGNARVNGCVDIGAYESPVIVSVACVVSGHELQTAGLLGVSPNPTVDFLQIQLPETASAAPADCQVFDAQGRMLMQRTLSVGQALDVRDLAPGMYALRVMQGGRAYAGRFVKL